MSRTDDLMHQVFQQNDDMAWRIVDDEAIVVDPQGSTATVLNTVGARIWELIDGKRTVAAIVNQIVEEYEVAHDRAEADAREFIGRLIDKKLVLTESQG